MTSHEVIKLKRNDNILNIKICLDRRDVYSLNVSLIFFSWQITEYYYIMPRSSRSISFTDYILLLSINP